jgi:hypothetical protein
MPFFFSFPPISWVQGTVQMRILIAKQVERQHIRQYAGIFATSMRHPQPTISRKMRHQTLTFPKLHRQAEKSDCRRNG